MTQEQLLLQFFKDNAGRSFTKDDLVHKEVYGQVITVDMAYRTVQKLHEKGLIGAKKCEDGKTRRYFYENKPVFKTVPISSNISGTKQVAMDLETSTFRNY